MNNLNNKRILITGVGIKPVDFVFKDITTGEPSHTLVDIDGKEYKANIGAATAFECAKAGAIVHIVARTESKLQIVKKWIEEKISGAKVEYSAVDLGNISALEKLVESIPNDLPLYWVQSVGLGAGTVQLKDDNPYLLIDDLSEELIEAELSVLKNTVSLLRLLLPRFRKQKETRVCIVSSMSAIRSVVSGSMHMAAKGSISRFTNAAMIELDKDKIFITDVRPGIVDTGMYDSRVVQNTVSMMGKNFGYDYSKTNLFCTPPSAVGKAIVSILTSDAHITSINMVARGQWPHEGS
ncbi:MAG: SDR family NAD(P)-dependent oxidoreductase [Candidatus Yanofskybacteria bacterium]|nr:SDR family NAD(P)-dependent oxidoreductase [Candidatus Yanofskybacteria bacterium]